ncbi:MAG: MBL fold metallo-hydrolase [Candidatus Cloacimonetes bacterium]|nr:MBL fold metallo-hydrolase [Candidatus Cloacimonadota bacterium]
MRISIIYDNTTTDKELIADWGFSCLVEFRDRKLLFDTGGNGKILLDNMRKMKINPADIDDVVISHPDFDHIGGLSAFLNKNSTAKIHVPISFKGIKYPNSVIGYSSMTQIYANVFLSGEMMNREQSLAIRLEKGIVIVVGCSHPGLGNIIKEFATIDRIYAVVGGFHGFDEFSVLNEIDSICATHCTVNKSRIQELFPKQFIEGGVGKIIEYK